jgi:hypothetical protein
MHERVEAYTPQMPAEHWVHIAGFVRATVLAAGPLVPYSTRTLLSTVSWYVLWCWQAACAPLTPADVFTPSLIEEWVTTGCPPSWGIRGRASTRSMLLRVSEALAPDAPGAPRRPLPATVGKAPYTSAEVLAIRGWASAQTTRRKTLDATAVCACGLGAGLRRDEVVTLRPADVIVDDLGVALSVSGPDARIVAVTADWEEEVAAVAQAALEDGADWLVTPGRRSTDGRLVANLIRNCHPATPRPDLQRMRSTWIVRHLTAGTLPAALVPAAGVDGLFSLARYLVYVPAVDPAESRRLLRLDGEGERT